MRDTQKRSREENILGASEGLQIDCHIGTWVNRAPICVVRNFRYGPEQSNGNTEDTRKSIVVSTQAASGQCFIKINQRREAHPTIFVRLRNKRQSTTMAPPINYAHSDSA